MTILVLTTEHAAIADLERELNEAHALQLAHDLETGVELLQRAWSLVIVDHGLTGDTTAEVVAAAVAMGQRVVVATQRPTLPLTLSVLRAGALDVLALPLDPSRVRELAGPVAATVAEAERATETATASLIGESRALLDAFRTSARAAETDVPVLIVGETGTGKELLARVIHENSLRAAAPFVTVNCAAIPSHLLESELLGHEPGALAGTFGRRVGRAQRAHGGSLFLDEIGALAAPLQAKLIRLLQHGVVEPIGAESPQPIDVRLIAATHFDLADAVAGERFRSDLYYALRAVEIALPPLRERGDDIRLLAHHFLRELSRSYGRDVRQIDAEAMERLQRFTWPGNIRQLRSALARAVVLADGDTLHASHLPPEILGVPPRPRTPAGEFASLAKLERQHIEDALALTAGHLGQAARLLGIHRNTLRRKLEALGLPQD
jgi:DNA-binding NtrC family response regulator